MLAPMASLPHGCIYRDPRHYDLLAAMTAPPDIPFYLRCVARYGGPVLELACGTGRVAIPMAGKGVAVSALDNSEPMIERARSKAQQAGVTVQFHHADCRDFDLDLHFALVVYPYNSINQLLEPAGIRSCLEAVRKHMTSDSRFVIDTFNPSLSFLSGDPERRIPVVEYQDPDDCRPVVMTERNSYDSATQINSITWYYRIGGVDDARIDELQMRIFFPQEFDMLLRLSGFEIEHKYGNYDETPFGSQVPKQLVVCRLA